MWCLWSTLPKSLRRLAATCFFDRTSLPLRFAPQTDSPPAARMCTCCSSALCGTPHRKASTFAATGALLIGLAFLLPVVIRRVVETKVCDQLCVPEADAAQWQLDNWRTNLNESMHPAELMSFYVYNITNVMQFAMGAKPVVEGARNSPSRTFQFNRATFPPLTLSSSSCSVLHLLLLSNPLLCPPI